jgi:Arc/MetJ-type ribon-helix-helix transcriptional regulator
VKDPVHVTLEHSSMVQVDLLVQTGKYRSRSHALDEAVKLLLHKEAVKL